MVTDSSDDNNLPTCAFRTAVLSINGGGSALGCAATSSGTFGDNDTVVFAPRLANSTITLGFGVIDVRKPMMIKGGGQTIDAAHLSRVVDVHQGAAANIEHLTLTGGYTPDCGGGIYAYELASLTLTDTVISGSTSGSGGAICALHATVTMHNSTVVASSGGAGQFLYATLVADRSTFAQNTATNIDCNAGLYLFDSHLILADSTVSGNSADCPNPVVGGIHLVRNSTAMIVDSTISGNTAITTGSDSFAAGALLVYQSTAVLLNTTIAHNGASGSDFIAGGLLEGHKDLPGSHYGVSLTGCTVTANTATASNASAHAVAGGAIGAFLTPGYSSRLTFANSILSANSATIGGNASATPDFFAEINVGGMIYSLLGSAVAGDPESANIYSDTPGLAPLTNNGGHTKTMMPLATSPAIDAGDNGLAVDFDGHLLRDDQTGYARVVGGIIDIGAVEFPGDHIFGDGYEP